jgi:hypothetical protein
MKKNIFLTVFMLFLSINSCAARKTVIYDEPMPEAGKYFLFVPDNETMRDNLLFHQYLRAWDKNEIFVNEEELSELFINYSGKETMNSLMFESFLRSTKNKKIQNAVLKYINKNDTEEKNFTNNLKKLYSSPDEEKINLFHFDKKEFFNREIEMPLFNNDWRMITPDNYGNKNEEACILCCGEESNSLCVSIKKFMNTYESGVSAKVKLDHLYLKNRDKIKTNGRSTADMLARTGADMVIITYGDNYIPVESATFNIYLFNKPRKTLYEARYFMNMSAENINYPERDRIFNYLFYQMFFVRLINEEYA